LPHIYWTAAPISVVQELLGQQSDDDPVYTHISQTQAKKVYMAGPSLAQQTIRTGTKND